MGTIVEIPFIMMSSMIFNIFWYFMAGFSNEAYRFFLYYLFFTLNMSFWTFIGQTFMALFKDVATAQGFGAVMNNFNSLFAGVLIRPQFITHFGYSCIGLCHRITFWRVLSCHSSTMMTHPLKP